MQYGEGPLRSRFNGFARHLEAVWRTTFLRNIDIGDARSTAHLQKCYTED